MTHETPDFSYIAGQHVDRRSTAAFQIFKLPGSPILNVRPATQQNAEYWNAFMKRGRHLIKLLKQEETAAQALAEMRNLDAELYPRYVLDQGWDPGKGPLDANGSRVPKTPENVAAFIDVLVTHVPDIFDDLREFCAKNANFRDDIDLEELDDLGNS